MLHICFLQHQTRTSARLGLLGIRLFWTLLRIRIFSCLALFRFLYRNICLIDNGCRAEEEGELGLRLFWTLLRIRIFQYLA